MWQCIKDINNSFPVFYGYFDTLCFNRDFRFSRFVQPVIILDNQELVVLIYFICLHYNYYYTVFDFSGRFQKSYCKMLLAPAVKFT